MNVSLLRTGLVCLGFVLASAGARAADTLAGAVTGPPAIQNIDAMRFSRSGLLLLGDARGLQVVVVDVGSLPPAKWDAAKIEKTEEKLASRVGVPAKMLEIKGLAVEPRSGTPFFLVRASNAKKPILLTMTGDGTINEFSLENVKHLALPLPKSEKETVSRITDLALLDDRILVGAASGAEFGSRVFSIPLDRKTGGAGFSIETFHVSHNKWETRAPMSCLMPFEEKGQKYVVGAFGCTPVVKYSVDKIQPDAKVKGESVIELGSGNQPRAMFAYEKDGKQFALMNTFRFHHERAPLGWSPYPTFKMDLALMGEHEKVNEKAYRRPKPGQNKEPERVSVVEPYFGVMFMDRLDATRAMTLKQEKDGSLSLAALPLP